MTFKWILHIGIAYLVIYLKYVLGKFSGQHAQTSEFSEWIYVYFLNNLWFANNFVILW